tara:strand:+ start:748 stop:978 length:231 start_codon:yes stop_codon:yes gene_type:complete
MIGEMFYKDLDDEVWQYELHTTPPEAIHWKKYKAKLADIKVISTADKETKDRIRKEILRDIELSDIGESKRKGRWW